MKPQRKIALLLLAIVVVSLAAGAYLGAHWMKRQLWRRNNPADWHVQAMRTLDSKLKLTPEQHAKVESILDGGVEQLKGIRIETIERSNKVLDRIIAEIGAELTPQQREEFAKLKAERVRASLDMLKAEPRKK